MRSILAAISLILAMVWIIPKAIAAENIDCMDTGLSAKETQTFDTYVSGFKLVFEARRKFMELVARLGHWEPAIVSLHVWILSRWPDTLIARKCGWEIAREATARATKLMDHAGADGALNPEQLGEFDAWLRADGHRRNPGTTADLIAATLFAALRDGLIDAPSG